MKKSFNQIKSKTKDTIDKELGKNNAQQILSELFYQGVLVELGLNDNAVSQQLAWMCEDKVLGLDAVESLTTELLESSDIESLRRAVFSPDICDASAHQKNLLWDIVAENNESY